VAIGLLLFLYILLNTGPSKIFNLIFSSNPLYFLLLVPVVCTEVLFRGLKWKIVIMANGLKFSLINSCAVYLIGFFAGMITPGRAGEVVKATYLQQNSKVIGRALSTVIVDRLIDVVTMLFLSILATFWISQAFSRTFISPIVMLVIVVLFILFVYLFFNEPIARKILRPFFNGLVPEKYKGDLRLNFDDFYGGIKDMNKKLIGIALVLGLATWFITALVGYVVLLSLGLQIYYPYLVMFIAIITLAEALPISIMGIGTRDAVSIVLFSLVGIAAEEAVAFSILYLVLGGGMVGLAGFVLMIKKPMSIKM
jgi:uncharacterized protein (TIRG00374 family)